MHISKQKNPRRRHSRTSAKASQVSSPRISNSGRDVHSIVDQDDQNDEMLVAAIKADHSYTPSNPETWKQKVCNNDVYQA
jgi:hypothetical protein